MRADRANPKTLANIFKFTNTPKQKFNDQHRATLLKMAP